MFLSLFFWVNFYLSLNTDSTILLFTFLNCHYRNDSNNKQVCVNPFEKAFLALSIAQA